MGRIKTKQIKAVTNAAYEKHKDKFTTSFEENKKVVAEIHEEIESKKLRNVLAGYATRLKKRDIKLGI